MAKQRWFCQGPLWRKTCYASLAPAAPRCRLRPPFVRYITAPYATLHHITIQYNTLQYNPIHYITSHYITCITMHHPAIPPCTPPQWGRCPNDTAASRNSLSVKAHMGTSHGRTSHRITSHCRTVRCIRGPQRRPRQPKPPAALKEASWMPPEVSGSLRKPSETSGK